MPPRKTYISTLNVFMNKQGCLSKVYMSKIYTKASMFEQINL